MTTKNPDDERTSTNGDPRSSFTITLSRAEKDAIAHAAESKGLKIAAFVRMAAIEAARGARDE